MYVEVAIPIPSNRTFTYSVPDESRADVAPGKRVLVPFGKRSLTGYILAIRRSTDRKDTREIVRVLDREPLFHEEDLRFYRWAADYYFTPLGRALGEILPGGIDIESLLWAVKRGDAGDLTPLQKSIVDSLGRRSSGMPLRSLEKELGKKTLLNELRKLEKRGILSLEERMRKPAVKGRTEKIATLREAPADPVKLTDRQRLALMAIEARGGRARVAELGEIRDPLPALRSLERKGFVTLDEEETLRSPESPGEIGRAYTPLKLNSEQEAALGTILNGISSGAFSPLLLHGVTGSGKTEVYIRAITEVLRQGGRAIYLVPEIALTPQLIGRMESRFAAGEIAVLHSGIGPAVRYDQWRKIERGEAKIVVGARSAIFAPFARIGLIIVDEEHDQSYKQEDRLRYHARDVALVRARMLGIPIMLGSATPSLQSLHHGLSGRYRMLALPSRISEPFTPPRPLPVVRSIRSSRT